MAVKERKTRRKPEAGDAPSHSEPVAKVETAKIDAKLPAPGRIGYFLAKVFVTVIAFVTRFHNIALPGGVVFDEVHFGKFASYYLERKYFFDVHPPFAKMLIAFVGWLRGYNGAFKFDSIGMQYPPDVPFVAYRMLSALQGALVVPVVFSIMEQCEFSVAACLVSSVVVALDNAQVLHSRLTLLDSTLVFSMVLSLYCYVRFLKHWRQPFTRAWHAWLTATGIALSSVMSTKFVGLFAFLTVGVSVLHDLWRLADIRNGNTMGTVYRHFKWRSILLIIVPFLYFLFWFWLHFAVLTNSGPGDTFMSRRFQATLNENPISAETLNVFYYDKVLIKSLGNPPSFLHSHPDRYPRQYPDNRISSGGQQVTAYPHEDLNNVWQIIPEIDVAEEMRHRIPLIGRQTVRLYHPSTDSYLLAHDVASPNYPAFEEFTTVTGEEADKRFNETLFELKLVENIFGQVMSKVTIFQIRHVATDVYMWQSDKILPEWGFGQTEINGPRHTNYGNAQKWVIDEIVDLEDRESRRPDFDDTGRQSMPFIYKWSELQTTMFRSNNNLVQDHPYNSWPKSWPFLIRGVSYWTDDATKSQIYLMGNYFGWYLELAALATFAVGVAADQLLGLRGIELFSRHSRRKLYRTVGWFFAAWAFHYLPFFTMHRQLFLHHYLPAHVLASLVVGGMADIVFLQQETAASFRKTNVYSKLFALTVLAGMTAGFFWVAPLTYGWPLTPAQVKARQIASVALHFNK